MHEKLGTPWARDDTFGNPRTSAAFVAFLGLVSATVSTSTFTFAVASGRFLGLAATTRRVVSACFLGAGKVRIWAGGGHEGGCGAFFCATICAAPRC